MNLPEINVLQLEQKRDANESFVLLDVREPHEVAVANLGDGVELAPMSELARIGLDALPETVRNDRDQEIVVMCHHGGRSAQVTAWLRGNGWTNVINLSGGIHAYSVHIDSSIPRY